jgi:two-component system chemotaxis response regulator CheB
MKNILIVDDSLIYRLALTSALSDETSFTVSASVKNGQEALSFILTNPLDLIVLDIEMPVMNGFQLIEKLAPLPIKPKIIVFTSLDNTGAENAMKALRLGADDFVTKVTGDGDVVNGIAEIKASLIPKIKSLLKITRSAQNTQPITGLAPVTYKTAGDFKPNKTKKIKTNYDYIILGASTGGPEALRFIFSNFNGTKMPPILIVQHMPPMYTSYLAQTLSESTSYKVMEAKHGDIIRNGHCYIAPGDFHMTINSDKATEMKISLNHDPLECYVRPAVNCLFRSANKIKTQSLFVVLTGMGSDGLKGIQSLSEDSAGPDVLIQDEQSSIVWGMPGEIFQKKLYSEIKSLKEIKETLMKLI